MSKQTEYERLKAEWVRNHPNAGYQEYLAAMKAIAKRLGL